MSIKFMNLEYSSEWRFALHIQYHNDNISEADKQGSEDHLVAQNETAPVNDDEDDAFFKLRKV